MFFEFNQNNSFGRFDVDDKVCNKLIIEAKNEEEAIMIAEDLGCYWNGVDEGIDCPCCGDRWYKDCIEITDKTLGHYTARIYDDMSSDAKNRWDYKYRRYNVIVEPEFHSTHSAYSRVYEGIIAFRNVEEYAQCMADDFGWTIPDCRIYYKDGGVKEIFSCKRIGDKYYD